MEEDTIISRRFILDHLTSKNLYPATMEVSDSILHSNADAHKQWMHYCEEMQKIQQKDKQTSIVDILSQEKKTKTDEKKILQDLTKKMEEQYHQLIGKTMDKEYMTSLY